MGMIEEAGTLHLHPTACETSLQGARAENLEINVNNCCTGFTEQLLIQSFMQGPRINDPTQRLLYVYMDQTDAASADINDNVSHAFCQGRLRHHAA